jgi:hypothetical protein
MYLNMRGRGLGADDELARIRDERAQVEAEIRRLQSGGAARPGGFTAAPALATAPASPPPLAMQPFGGVIPSWAPKAALGGALLILGLMFMPGGRRR